MAEDTLALMDHLGWQSAHVVGHSLGGHSLLSSLHFRHETAHEVERTHIVDRSAFALGNPYPKKARFPGDRLGPGELARCDRDRVAADLAPLVGHDLAGQPSIVMMQLAAMRAYDGTSRLPTLAAIPTLVVNAAHEILRVSRRLHGVTVRRADEINALLESHFRESLADGPDNRAKLSRKDG